MYNRKEHCFGHRLLWGRVKISDRALNPIISQKTRGKLTVGTLSTHQLRAKDDYFVSLLGDIL